MTLEERFSMLENRFEGARAAVRRARRTDREDSFAAHTHHRAPGRERMMRPPSPSWPGLTRPSTSSRTAPQFVDARIKSGHDGTVHLESQCVEIAIHRDMTYFRLRKEISVIETPIQRRMRIKLQLQNHARRIGSPNDRRAWIMWERANLDRDRESALRRGANEEASDAMYFAHGLWQVLVENERAATTSPK